MKLREGSQSVCAVMVLVIFLTGTLLCPVASAGDVAVRDISQRMSAKFVRGLINIATGWMEMIRCPGEVARARGKLHGAVWGTATGVCMSVFRTVGGVFETALFFYPLPGFYDPFFESEFVFSKTVAEEPPPELP